MNYNLVKNKYGFFYSEFFRSKNRFKFFNQLKFNDMKLLSLILSLTVLNISAYFFVTDFNISADFNQIIYSALLLILMLVCIVGVLLTLPSILKERKAAARIVYSRFSEKIKKSNNFELQFETS